MLDNSGTSSYGDDGTAAKLNITVRGDKSGNDGDSDSKAFEPGDDNAVSDDDIDKDTLAREDSESYEEDTLEFPAQGSYDDAILMAFSAADASSKEKRMIRATVDGLDGQPFGIHLSNGKEISAVASRESVDELL